MKKNKSTRDQWIPVSWSYNGAGYQKNKKKQLVRKTKHKGHREEKSFIQFLTDAKLNVYYYDGKIILSETCE